MNAKDFVLQARKRDKDDLNGKIQDYNEAIKLNPDYMEAYWERGNAYFGKEDLTQAIQDYDKALSYRHDYLLLFHRGKAHYQTRAYVKALDDFTLGLRLSRIMSRRRNSHDLEAYMIRGWIYYLEKQYDSAIADFSTVIEHSPDNINAYELRGQAYFDTQNYEEVIADFTEVIENDTQKAPPAYVTRGAAYYELKQYDAAINDFQQALQFDSQKNLANHNLGLVYVSLKKYDLAIAKFEEVIRLDSKQSTLYMYLIEGIQHEKNNDLKKANINYQKYIDEDGLDVDEINHWIQTNNHKMKQFPFMNKLQWNGIKKK